MRAETGSKGIAPGGSIVPASFPVGATCSLPLQPIERETRADTTHACLNLDAMGLLLSEGSDLGLYEPTLPPPELRAPELRARFSAQVPLYSSSAASEMLFPGRGGATGPRGSLESRDLPPRDREIPGDGTRAHRQYPPPVYPRDRLRLRVALDRGRRWDPI